MKNFNSFSKTAFYVLILLQFLYARSEEGCPPDEDIQPCICHNAPYPVLQCTSITNEDILRNVFAHSKGYRYREVHLAFASLKYLPQELFLNTVVEELHLTNSTLNYLFDTPPDDLQKLYKLHLENTKVIEISHWELLEHLTHLTFLEIYYNPIERIDSTIGKYISKDIKQIVFYATGTKYIMPGALVDIPKLDRISVDNAKLKEISRDIFPTPSNIKHIYFNNNEIKVIPDDMFTDMPRLKTVGLRENLIVTIPESAFGGNVGQLDWLFLEGNALKCNCDLRWLINNKPPYLSGLCSTPLRLHNKPLKELQEEDLRCKA